MDPSDPANAQQVVIEYARVLEADYEHDRHPSRVDALPFAKPVIKTAIQTSVQELARSGQLTDELRDYLEVAYVSLAEYLDVELVDLMKSYRQSADQLPAEPVSVQDKTKTPAWRTLVDSGALAGEVARTTTIEAEQLRREFREFLKSG